MAGIVNREKRRMDFLKKVNEKADEELKEAVRRLKEDQDRMRDRLKVFWKPFLDGLQSEYGLLEAAGSTGPLSFSYLSFLRSGILDGGPWLRMDYYDSRGRASDVECGGCPDGFPAFPYLDKGFREIRELFAGQSQAGAYLADPILYDLADRYSEEMEPLVLESLFTLIEEEGERWYGSGNVRFFAGDFLDRAEPAAEWRDGKLRALQAGVKRQKRGKGKGMGWEDERVVHMQNEERKKKYCNLDTGMYIKEELICFERFHIDEMGFSLVLPKGFARLDEGALKRKYPSPDRPDLAVGNEAGDVVFAFSALKDAITGSEFRKQTVQSLKGLMSCANPSLGFLDEGEEESGDSMLNWFDFKSYVITGTLYNLASVISFRDRSVLGMFSCPYELSPWWKPVYLKVLETFGSRSDRPAQCLR